MARRRVHRASANNLLDRLADDLFLLSEEQLLTLERMSDPVVASDGHSYERVAIADVLASATFCGSRRAVWLRCGYALGEQRSSVGLSPTEVCRGESDRWGLHVALCTTVARQRERLRNIDFWARTSLQLAERARELCARGTCSSACLTFLHPSSLFCITPKVRAHGSRQTRS